MSKRTAKWLIIPALIIVLLAGCSTEQPSPSPSIDPPPEGAWEDVLDEQWEMDEIDEAAEKGAYAPVTLYYKDEYGHVAPVTMRIPMTPEIAQRALEYMIDGNTSSKELPAGFTGLIPAGTTVLGMQIVEDEKLAIVDFSPEFASYDAKDERKIVEAITWALTSFPTIDKVKLWINGVPLHEMPVNGLPLQEPLTRSFGINLESIEGVHLASAQPITLYFKSETKDGFEYLVPVTRMIQRSEDKAAAVLRELIEGPNSQGLYAVLAPDVEVLELAAMDDLVMVDFNDYILDPEFRILEESMQSVILSLTENQVADQVQIKVNGNVEVLSSDNQSLTQPASRPDHINWYNL